MRDLSRWVVIAAALGLWALAFDSAVGHFAGHEAENLFLQLVPIAVGLLGGVVLLVGSPRWLKTGWRWVARTVGAICVAIGLAGTWFHGHELWEELSEDALSWGALEGGLSVAPPLGAPGGFIAVGVLLLAVASVRVRVELAGRGATAPDSTRGSVR